MKPTTSFETYLRAIQQKESGAAAFIGMGSVADARRLRAEIMTMHMSGVTEREASTLANRVKVALRSIDAQIEKVPA